MHSSAEVRCIHCVGVAVILMVHAALVGWGATQHSPTMDETGNLAAGLVQWHSGQVGFSPHNPPLVRLAAAAPVFLSPHLINWEFVDNSPLTRPEIDLGGSFVSINGLRSFWLFALARWACTPFSLLGGWICWKWGCDLYGVAAGYLAIWLWCFSPSILAAAQSITPDMGATAFGLSACYVYWRWIRCARWTSAIFAGVLLGTAALGKATWLPVGLMLPGLWLLKFCEYRDWMTGRCVRMALMQLAAMLIMAIWTLNAGYGFRDTMKPLGDLSFYSETLSSKIVPRFATSDEGGNRFRSTLFGRLPVPLPRAYVSGLDLQKREFELGYRSYLQGQWKHGGWWYYYLYALIVKTPSGVLMLFAMSTCCVLISTRTRTTFIDSAVLLGPPFGVLVLVSSQTGYNHHFRYVLPVLPFVFIWSSRVISEKRVHESVSRATRQRRAACKVISLVLVAWSTLSSLSVYPQSAAYFNAAAGGAKCGSQHLLDSNIGAELDLLRLKKWFEQHTDARPLGLVTSGSVDPRAAGIDFHLPKAGPTAPGTSCIFPASEVGPQPGWYAIDVRFVRGMRRRVANGSGGWEFIPSLDCDYSYFQHFEPVAKAGYTMFIYHLKEEETNEVRQRLGLPTVGQEST